VNFNVRISLKCSIQKENNVTFLGFRLILFGFWFFKFANWFLGDDRKVGEGYSLSSAWLLKN